MSETLSQSPPKTPRKFFISIRVKLILAVILLFAIVDGFVFSWFYSYAHTVALSRIDHELKTLLNGTIHEIDGDAFEQMAKAVTPEKLAEAEKNKLPYPSKEKNPLYWEHAEILARIKRFQDSYEKKDKDGKPAKTVGIYTFIKVPNSNPRKIIFIGSSGALDEPPTGAEYLWSCEEFSFDCTTLQPNYKALEGEDFVIQEGTNDDEFGVWHSGYQPIRNSKNEVVGALGVDIAENYLSQVQKDVLQGIIIASIASFIALLALVFLMSSLLTKSLSKLTQAAEQIGKGNYAVDLSHLIKAKIQDEFGRLADTVNSMAKTISSSQEQLEGKVKERTRELDANVKELERVNKFMVNRELKMAEMKKEMEELEDKLQAATKK